MHATLRLLRPALAALALGLAGRATAQSGSSDSPFMPRSGPVATAAAPNETIEFAGINVMGTKTFVSVYDKTKKKGYWVEVGGSEGPYSVLAFDPRREQIVVKTAEFQKTLTLRKSTGPVNLPAAVPVMPAAAGFAVADPRPITFSNTLPNPPPGSVNDATGSAPSPAATPVEAAPVKPEAPAKPLSVARQEEEARMLVSDLLEIGMAQRKAYEEAQKKAAAGNAPASTPPPPPGG